MVDAHVSSGTTKDPNLRALAALRIAIGLFFVIFGEYKVFGSQFTLGGGFEAYIKEFLRGGAYPFMIPILKGILEDCPTFVAFLVAYGEFLIGISLVCGVWSRVASVFGFLLMTAMGLSAGYPGPHAALWMYWGASLNWSVFALCFAALAWGRPDDIFSVRRIKIQR